MKKIFIIIAAVLVVIVGTGVGAIYYIDSKIFVSTKNGSSSTGNSISTLQSLIDSVTNQGGTDNIVLSGTDARSKDTTARTDSIMMATIDRNNKEIKLTSFMRDMYVSIPGHLNKSKINNAFYWGGPDLMMETLNQNFNTNAQYYMTIDFSAFQSLVDKFNGIDLDVKPNEIKEINKYIKEENWHNPDFITKSGMQHLNGQQVLSYCRIRHVGNSDYERTERQRRVLTLLIQKVRKENIFSLPGLLNAVLPYIKTNIPSSKLLAFGISAYKFSKTPVSTIRIPADGMYTNKVINGQDVLVADLQENTDLLSKFIASSTVEQNKDSSSGTKNTENANTKQIASTTNRSNSRSIDPRVPSAQGNTAQTDIAVNKGNITVCLLNSTGKAGLAAEYKTKLEALGYNVIKTDNYPYKKYLSTIINDYSKYGDGDLILQDLNFGNIIKKHKARPLANIVIILGSDSVK